MYETQARELRNRTGANMMDCKKALQETDGDVDKAIEVLVKLVTSQFLFINKKPKE